jgi:hypothetical protein
MLVKIGQPEQDSQDRRAKKQNSQDRQSEQDSDQRTGLYAIPIILYVHMQQQNFLLDISLLPDEMKISVFLLRVPGFLE